MKKLRDYQIKIKENVYKEWEKGHKNVMLCLPTGGGKSVILSSIAADILKYKKFPVAITVHRKELVSQLCITLAEFGLNHNIIAPRPVIKGIVAAQRRILKKQFYEYNASITVISVDTLNARILTHERWAKTVKFWIVDEAAHLLKDNKWGRAVNYFVNAEIGLGVTATPRRLDGKGLGNHVDGVFHTMVEGPDVKWLIDNEFLSKYKIVIPESDYKSYLKESAAGSDYTKEAMAVASERSHIVGDVVANYLKFAKGKQAIVFASDIAAAERMTSEFIMKGVKATLLTGFSSDDERLTGMLDFREKKIQVLVNVDLFDEGLDVPNIECVILARPTKSLSKMRQQIGRSLRPEKDKSHAIIIDHVGNIKYHGLPCSKIKWSLDRPKKKKKKKSDLMRVCANWRCMAPFDKWLHKCPFCGQEDEPKKPGEGPGRVPLAQVDGDLVMLDPDTLRSLEKITILENPESIASRVEYVAGKAAGIKAMRNQQDRIDTQRLLADAIAVWAGEQKALGLSDREIHKKFYLDQGLSINEALSKPKADMLKTIEELKEP